MKWTAEVLDELKTKADPEADRIAAVMGPAPDECSRP